RKPVPQRRTWGFSDVGGTVEKHLLLRQIPTDQNSARPDARAGRRRTRPDHHRVEHAHRRCVLPGTRDGLLHHAHTSEGQSPCAQSARSARLHRHAHTARRDRITRSLRSIGGHPPGVTEFSCQCAPSVWIGEWIAARIFEMSLRPPGTSRVTTATSRPELRPVKPSMKDYTRLEGMLDINPNAPLDAYLVLTGPK